MALSIGTGISIGGGITITASGGATQQAIFGFGSPITAATNLVSNTGVVATDTTGVGTARSALAACGFSFS